MKTFIAAAFLASAFLATAAQASGPDAYIGELYAMPSAGYLRDRCPMGSHAADGTEYKIYDKQALYFVLGDKYGGDGKQTFKLPDFRDAGPQPKTGPKFIWCIVIEGTFPQHPD